MRVMYVITRGDDIGGAQMMVRDLAIGTRERGHEVRVVTGIGGPLTEQLAEHGIESRICPGMLREIDPRQDVRAVRAMTDLIREFQSRPGHDAFQQGGRSRPHRRPSGRRSGHVYRARLGASPVACRSQSGRSTG